MNETFPLLLCTKITFIHSSALVGFFKYMHLIYIYILKYIPLITTRNMAQIKPIYGCHQTSFYIAVIKCHVRRTYFKMEHYMLG